MILTGFTIQILTINFCIVRDSCVTYWVEICLPSRFLKHWLVLLNPLKNATLLQPRDTSI